MTTLRPLALVVDDEEAIRQLVDFHFQRAGFETELYADGEMAYERLGTSNAPHPDIVILDIMLPGMDGFEVCRKLRMSNVRVPIILLTAREEEIDRVLGLEMGADDYVTKPFSPRELVARAKAVLRRAAVVPAGLHDASVPATGPNAHVLVAGDISMDLLKHEAAVRGQVVELTPKEFDLLQYLMENHERVLTRDQLLDQVWGYASVRDTRIVDVHVSHLRDKIEPATKHPTYIRTVRGIGYKFAVAVSS